jgi:hypothetical protein
MPANAAACPSLWFLRFFVSMAGPFFVRVKGAAKCRLLRDHENGSFSEKRLGDCLGIVWGFPGLFVERLDRWAG